MENFKGGRPDSIYILPSRQASCHNGCEEEPHVSWQKRVYDQKLIYARVIGLLASSREINFNYVSAFELVACSPSILLIGTSITASIPSRGRREQYQVAFTILFDFK